MKISRPCYNKMHQCPGWAGGGMKFAEVTRCDSGSLGDELYDKRLWKWRTNRCGTCGLLVLPCMVRWVDPGWWRHTFRMWWWRR